MNVINLALLIGMMVILWFFAIEYDWYYQEQQSLKRPTYHQVEWAILEN